MELVSRRNALLMVTEKYLGLIDCFVLRAKIEERRTMDLENKHLAAGLICEKMFDPIETTCDLSLFSADERCLIETIVQSIMKNMDGGADNG